MICANCGANLSDDLKFCTQCGTPLENQTEVLTEKVTEEAYVPEEVYTPEADANEVYTPEVNADEVYFPQVTEESYSNDSYDPELQQDSYQQAQNLPPVPETDPGKGLGMAGMILTIIGLLFSTTGLISIVGLILGFVGNSKSKAAGFDNKFAFAGIVMGFVKLASMIISIIVAIVIVIFYVAFYALAVGGIVALGTYY